MILKQDFPCYVIIEVTQGGINAVCVLESSPIKNKMKEQYIGSDNAFDSTSTTFQIYDLLSCYWPYFFIKQLQQNLVL